MIQYIKNEFYKIRYEKFMVYITILSLVPFMMNGINFYINDDNLSLKNGFYFRLYNQYLMLLPIITSVIAASIFYMEYTNRTLLTWLSYDKNKFKLFNSKVLAFLLISLQLMLVNLFIIIIFYAFNNAGLLTLGRISLSFISLNIFIIVSVGALTLFIINITKNIIISFTAGIVFTIISMILIAAPFSYLLPATLGYRIGHLLLDSSFYYDKPLIHTLTGFLITVITTLSLYFLAYKKFKIHE
ncbi:hypothetical protein E4T89_05775 [Jeotgalicoccus nanhaiensis]|uniref:ABC transporter permease n=1 Tax=Jeotgalicoccus nanhaiensis TaxID=568603 RepID=A0ABR9XY06_9STAP|nr:ABC transporter permease [Jeotgalicoccus nanhaiensis]MBF0753777.1 ABC transporter permease [Jeotgalicoccus nanhaiensis]TFU61939.1 hypothetical protein E4T89_05775 [Jeotgalicoccus nanhaiensis]